MEAQLDLVSIDSLSSDYIMSSMAAGESGCWWRSSENRQMRSSRYYPLGRASVLASPNISRNQGSRGHSPSLGWHALLMAGLIFGAAAAASEPSVFWKEKIGRAHV